MNQHHGYVAKPTTPPLHPAPETPIRERGASNIAMLWQSEFLIHDTGRRIAAQLAKRPGVRVQIYTSAFDRTIKTAEILATELKAFHAKVITVPELAPQSLGGLEGQVSSTVKSTIDQLRTTALNAIPPGTSPLTGQNGESTDHYAKRLLPQIEKLMKETSDNPNLVAIVCDHSSGLKVIKSWVMAGSKPTLKLDTRYLKASIDGQRVDGLLKTRGGMWVYRNNIIPRAEDFKIILLNHGPTEFNVERN